MNTDRFKFRVWDNDAEEYIDDGALLDGRTGKISGNGNYTIEQCTGVRDKNGKLIYEGDVVNAKWGPNVIQAKIEHKSSGAFVLHDGKRPIITVDDPHDIEIIGNIHENGGDNGKTV